MEEEGESGAGGGGVRYSWCEWEVCRVVANNLDVMAGSVSLCRSYACRSFSARSW